MWRIVRVKPSDPSLIDRTHTLRLATTDPENRTIYVSDDIYPPLLDQVLLHEVAHAFTFSYNILDYLHEIIPKQSWIAAEELIAQIVENFSVEASIILAESLARPLCIRGYCLEVSEDG